MEIHTPKKKKPTQMHLMEISFSDLTNETMKEADRKVCLVVHAEILPAVHYITQTKII